MLALLLVATCEAKNGEWDKEKYGVPYSHNEIQITLVENVRDTATSGYAIFDLYNQGSTTKFIETLQENATVKLYRDDGTLVQVPANVTVYLLQNVSRNVEFRNYHNVDYQYTCPYNFYYTAGNASFYCSYMNGSTNTSERWGAYKTLYTGNKTVVYTVNESFTDSEMRTVEEFVPIDWVGKHIDPTKN